MKPALAAAQGSRFIFITSRGLHKALVILSEAEESTVCDAKPPGVVVIGRQVQCDSRRPGVGVRLSDQKIRPEVMN